MKQLLHQILQDTDRHAAAELRQMLAAEMAKPPESRDYDRIRELSEACCEVMGVRQSAANLAPSGIRAVRERIEGKAPEAQCETYVVEIAKPRIWQHILTAAAACIVLVLGVAGGSALLRQTAHNVPAPLPEPSESTTQETEQAISTVPVLVPAETAGTTTAPTMTVQVTDAAEKPAAETAPAHQPQATEPPRRPQETAPAADKSVQQTTASAVQTQTAETATETVPAETETVPPQESEMPAPTEKPTTRLLKIEYELGWIPDGYALADTSYYLQEDYEIRFLSYTSETGTITFLQRTRNAPSIHPFETGYPDEDYEMLEKNIRIGPYSGYLGVCPDDAYLLTWDVGEYIFTLTGPDAEDLRQAALALCIAKVNEE